MNLGNRFPELVMPKAQKLLAANPVFANFAMTHEVTMPFTYRNDQCPKP